MSSIFAPLRRLAGTVDARARALDQRMLADQLRRYPLDDLERQRYVAWVVAWGGLRGWLLVLLGLSLLVGGGLAVSALTAMPASVAVMLSLCVAWVALAIWVGWLLPSLVLKPPTHRGKAWVRGLLVMVLGAVVGWLVARAAIGALPKASVGASSLRLVLAADWPWLVAVLLGALLLVHLLIRGPARLRAHFDHTETERLRQEIQAQRQQLELAQTHEREQQLQIALAQSHLQMLRAQIEPHFIFNTLGAVQQLAEPQAPEAAALVSQLIVFLRAAMPNLRRPDTTLGEELALVEAYLGIMQTRIGPRLSWRVAIADEPAATQALADCRIPPALLLTLVENAIKHGIEPCCSAAEVVVGLKRSPAGLELRVTDTGVGLAETGLGSTGVGLANLRAQLQTLYGAAATVELGENSPKVSSPPCACQSQTGPRASASAHDGKLSPRPAPRALIAEDEALMRERLLGQLARLWPELQIVAACENGPDAWDAFLRDEPEIVFLDIRLPGLSGLDVAARIGEQAHLVFVTAYDEHAIEAFRRGARDYLLKPVAPERLSETIARLKRALAQREPPAPLGATLAELRASLKANAPTPKPLKWIKASLGKQVKLLPVDEVLYFQADAKYTRVVLADEEAVIRTPIKDLLAELDPEQFWQIHRGTLVAVRAIASLYREEAERQFVLLRGRSERLAVSRAFYHLFKEA